MKISALVALLGASTSAVACLTPLERRGGYPGGLHKSLQKRNGTIDTANWNDDKIQIGQGDRFNNGNTVPRGAGSQLNPTYDTFLSYVEVDSALRALAKAYKNVQVFDAPFKTYENRTVRGIKVAGKKSNPKNNKGYTVLIQGGVHPRERGSTDHLIYFTADLLWAAKQKQGLTYGGVKYTAKQIQDALDVGFVILPMVNPDGTVFDQTTHACWRKNRNLADAIPGDSWSVGVDLNRNFDIAWNTTEYLAAEAVFEGQLSPSSQTYPGRGPFSEPETKNIRWTLDNFPDIGWYADTHSFAGIVGYGRCTDSVQTVDKSMNWRNPSYNSVRGVVPDRPSEGIYYKEYMDKEDLAIVTNAAARMTASMREATVDRYTDFLAVEISQIFYSPSTGCSIDHTYSRHILDKKKKKIHSLAFEFGAMWEWSMAENFTATACEFYPTVEQYSRDMRDVGAALATLFLSASDLS